MNNRAVGYFTIGTIIAVLLGLLVVFIVAGGPGFTAYKYVKDKLFGDEGLFSAIKFSSEKDFEPVAFKKNVIVLPNDKQKAKSLIIEKTLDCWKQFNSINFKNPIHCYKFIRANDNFITVSKDEVKRSIYWSTEAEDTGFVQPSISSEIAEMPEFYELFGRSKPEDVYFFALNWNIPNNEPIYAFHKEFYICAHTGRPDIAVSSKEDSVVAYLSDSLYKGYLTVAKLTKQLPYGPVIYITTNPEKDCPLPAPK